MDLIELEHLLNKMPVIVKGMDPISIIYLHHPISLYESLQELAWLLDDTQWIQPHCALTFDTNLQYSHRFPVVTIEHDPFTSELNNYLIDKYNFIENHMLNQAHISEHILAEADLAKTVVLVLLDGLSYSDVKDWPGVVPCLAAHPTITKVGFPTIIGDPPVAARLFKKGITRRIGFTYWERDDNVLTNKLFRTITNTVSLNPTQPNTFNQVIDWLSNNDLSGVYIQIIRTALDDFAEGHRSPIPRNTIVQQIRNDLEAILDILLHRGLPAILFAISDHGILWKEDDHKIENVGITGARYAQGRGGPGRGRSFEVDGVNYWVLDYPQMGRLWHKNEQGVHGGISFEESIVPFIQWEVNNPC